MRFVGFIGPSYQLRSVNVDCQRTINLYPEIDELGTGKEKEVASLIQTPGLSTLLTLGDGPIRATYTSSLGKLYVVSGTGLYYVDSTWTATLLGNLITTLGQVSIADNGLHICLVDGANGYTYTLGTSTFAQITSPNFLGADTVAFQDGYFIFNKPNSGQFYISGLNAVTFNGLDTATSEGNPDNVVAVLSSHRDLWVFNEQTVEVFYDSGSSGFPFTRVQGAFIEQGCAAKYSPAKMNNTVFWLGRDQMGAGVVYMAQGYQPMRISTHAVENAIQNYATISDAVAYTYQENGHHFYVLNFQAAQTTWVFDSTTKMWHERNYNNEGNLERHRANSHAYAYGTHVVGDYANGKVYKMSSDIYTDAGTPIIRTRIAPHLSQDMMRIFYTSFQLDIETGTGLDGTTQGTDPQAMLSWSDDGGHKWSSEMWCSFGKIGQTKKRVIFRRLGSSRDRVFKLSISDPVRITLIGAELQTTAGTS